MPIHAILAALIVVISWGGNYSASRYSLHDFPPFLMLLIRFIALSILLAPFAAKHKRPPLKQMLIISVVLVTLQFGFMFYALHMGLSITSGVIATQLGMPFSCMMAAILFKDRLGPWRALGLAVAFAGVVIVAGTPDVLTHPLAFLLAVCGALSWSGANLYLKTIDAPHGVPLLFWPGLLAIPQLLALTLLLEHDHLAAMQQASMMGWLGIAYSTIFSSIVGYGLWNWLIKNFPITRVMPFGLLMPIFGIGFGAMLFDEHLSTRVLLGAGLTMLGVAVITIRRPKLATTEH